MSRVSYLMLNQDGEKELTKSVVKHSTSYLGSL